MADKAGDVGPVQPEKEDKQVQQPPVEPTVDFPDPDEDDLDDLDDMLNEFSVNAEPAKPAAQLGASQPVSGPSIEDVLSKSDAQTSDPAVADDDPLSDEDFAKQLQEGMASLLGDMENSPDMAAKFESIFKELGAAAAAETPASSQGPSGASPSQDTPSAGADASFQETIRRTMERMQNSGEQATAAAAAGGSDDFLAEMLKQMQAGDLGGEGSDEEFSKMLLSMMDQLTNKEILYVPMKELHEKFPEWLDKNRATTSEEDLKRYEEQQVYAKEIVAKFEETTYSDSNAADREYIVERMQKMQAAGQPPPDLVGDMPSTQEALDAPEESCNPQ